MLRTIYFSCLLLLAVLLTSSMVSAQFEKPFFIESKVHYGYLAAHREGFKNLVTGHIAPIELTYLKNCDSKPWHKLYREPIWGFTLFYSDFNNPAQLGWGMGLAAHLSFHFYRTAKSELNFRIGSGLGYVSKIFDRYENFKNVVVGSHLNLFVIGQLEERIHLTDRLDWSIGAGGFHYSNTAFKMPNLGYNFLTINTGIALKIGDNAKPSVVGELPERSRTMEYNVGAGFGFRENYPVGGPRHFAGSLMLEAMKPIADRCKLGFGTDIIYNTSVIHFLDKDTSITTTGTSPLQNGIKANYEMHISRLSLLLQFGAYTHTLYKGDGPFYHRIGARVGLIENWILNLTLKSHFAKADYFELGVVYQFKK